ncbi:hypothetical protein CVT26_015017 [Gymnopilus dilepis]|uniref:F-box domain-containing protein n=1 Tax=Gymnopilus dilepis TaxID=231916 RepID=A0A409YNV6_9AGAR|nr:hypothetical protein CVT26_015017 [Gymnopilus dilepis]
MSFLLHRLCKVVARTVRRAQSKFRKEKFPFQHLPRELQLICFSYMTVETLIAARSVCSTWRSLLPHAEMMVHPIRLRLYRLYLKIIANPRPDRQSQRYISQFIRKKFNREKYLRYLTRRQFKHHTVQVPDEFRIWVLEWPAKLVINGLWPGLPFSEFFMSTAATAGASLRCGINYLARRPAPRLELIVESYTRRRPQEQLLKKNIWACMLWRTTWSEDNIECMFSWYHHPSYTVDMHSPLWNCETWLIFDTGSPHFGKVVECPPFHFSRRTLSDVTYTSAHPDWIDYLERKWFGVPPCGRASTGTRIPSFLVVHAFYDWIRFLLEPPGPLTAYTSPFCPRRT